VTLFLVLLISITFSIFRNYFTVKNNDATITALKKAQIGLDDSLSSLAREARIITLLRTLARAPKVPDRALCEVAAIVSRNSGQFGYDPLLLLAVIRVESFFNTHAQGRYLSGERSGALGLMQLKLKTASEIARLLHLPPLTENDLLNPEINLVVGVAYLTQLIAQFRSFKLGLLAYNQGPGTIYQTLSAHEPLSLGYYQTVLKNYYHLKKLAAKIEK